MTRDPQDLLNWQISVFIRQIFDWKFESKEVRELISKFRILCESVRRVKLGEYPGICDIIKGNEEPSELDFWYSLFCNVLAHISNFQCLFSTFLQTILYFKFCLQTYDKHVDAPANILCMLFFSKEGCC